MPRAGLDTATITAAGAALADEVGLAHLGMGLVAQRLDVRAPSLYRHVDGLADLVHRIAVLAVTEVGDALRDATQGRACGDALAAAARAVRAYARTHPGRCAATTGARPTGLDDPLSAASARVLASLAAVLRGYRMDPGQEVHALRMLRSVLHGFATLEGGGGFQIDTDVDDSSSWMMDLIDRGLRAGSSPDARRPVAPASDGRPGR